jgi:TolA-binding protein
MKGDVKKARQFLSQVVKQHPSSRAASSASSRLRDLKKAK